MNKIVSVIAVCLTCVLLTGFDVSASATKAATDKSVKESTFIDEVSEVTAYKGVKEKTGKKKANRKTKKNSNKKTNKKSNKAANKTTGNTSRINSTADEEQKKAKKKLMEVKYSQAELKYMTSIIYCEARGEDYAGQMAVGIVVMNRKKDDEFPNSIKKVIYQRGQFSPTRNGAMDRALSVYEKYNKKGRFGGEMKSCYKAAKEVLSGTTKIRVNGKEKEMKKFLYFSQRISGAKYTLGGHQFK